MLRIVPSIIYNVKVNKKGKYETHQNLYYSAVKGSGYPFSFSIHAQQSKGV
jgi:hypothetical protein